MKIVNLKKNKMQNKGFESQPHETAVKNSLRPTAKKLLTGFFVAMIILTLISKAADSITIAQVTVQNLHGSTLTFEAEGSGIITADAKKIVRITEGIGIDKVNVTQGQLIKKGDVLFTLYESDIEAALVAAERETEKLSNQIALEKLSISDSYLSDKEVKESALSYAKDDLATAKTDAFEAQSRYDEANRNIAEAENNYKQAFDKSIAELYEQKEQEYNEAKAAYDNVLLSNEEALTSSSRDLNNAQDTLTELKSKDDKVISYLNQYCNYYNSDATIMRISIEGQLSLAYGDEDVYQKHLEHVSELENKLDRAYEDYLNAVRNYEKQKEQQENTIASQDAINTAYRAYQDAKYDLSAENKKDSKIRAEINNFLSAKLTNHSDNMDDAITEIYNCIYGISGYKKHLDDISKAERKISQIKEDINTLQKKNDLTISIERQKLDKMQEQLVAMNNGAYESKGIADVEKQAIETAKQEASAQKQTIKESEKALISVNRSLQAAEFEYRRTILQDESNAESLLKQKEAANLRISIFKLDLEDKQQAISNLTNLKKSRGKVKASVSGTVDRINIETGKKTTSDGSIIINTGGYGINVTLPKDQGEFIAIGDRIELKRKGEKETITVTVHGIKFTTDQQQKEMLEITAVMPKGDYIPGTTYDAKITKSSALYDTCLPIEAIRSDFTGTYCLVTQSRNTILGEELVAVKIPIKIIDKDLYIAAVEGSLTNTDDVIISSSKDIQDGDRIRIKN